MPIRRFVLTLFVALLGVSVLPVIPYGATTQMGVNEIRPGMVGIGRTVFDGTHVEEFRANILGVLENVIGTHRNLILARLEGEPLAGITPIAEMTDSTSFSDTRPTGARVHIDYPLNRDNLTAAFRKALNWNRPFAERPDDTQLAGVSAVAGLGGSRLGTLLRPIATPLVMSGFEPELADIFGSAFREQGFIPTGGSAAGFRAGEAPFEGPLKPGDAVGVMLVSGDLQLGGTGTITHIDGDRVYAFGHPMYNLGPTEFPMTRAYVYTVLPSLFSSMKLSSTGEVIGTFLQDRATAIAGRLGPAPKLLPVTLTLESDRAPKRSFHFGVV